MSTSGIKKTVERVPFVAPIPGRVRNRVSNFLVTLNTNTRVSEDLTAESPLVTVLQQTAGELFEQEEHFLKFVQFPKGGQWDDTNIVALDVVTGVEIGTDELKGKRLHLHAQFKVTHRSFLKLDYTVIKEEINRMLESKGYPLKIHYVHGSFHKSDMAGEYVRKNLAQV